ncbi:MAG: hypothetical protein ACTSVM_00360, partial [Candidatus Ranarchaeia archaeon]
MEESYTRTIDTGTLILASQVVSEWLKDGHLIRSLHRKYAGEKHYSLHQRRMAFKIEMTVARNLPYISALLDLLKDEMEEKIEVTGYYPRAFAMVCIALGLCLSIKPKRRSILSILDKRLRPSFKELLEAVFKHSYGYWLKRLPESVQKTIKWGFPDWIVEALRPVLPVSSIKEMGRLKHDPSTYCIRLLDLSKDVDLVELELELNGVDVKRDP